MRKAVKKFGTNDYSKIFLSYNHDTFEFASKNFYPSFLAAVEVAKSPDKFFTNMASNQKSPLIGPKVLDQSLRLGEILLKYKISKELLKQFNPHIMSIAFKKNSQIPKGVNIYIPNSTTIENRGDNNIFPSQESESGSDVPKEYGALESEKLKSLKSNLELSPISSFSSHSSHSSPTSLTVSLK